MPAESHDDSAAATNVGRRHRAALIAIVLGFIVSRLLYEPMSVGTSTFSFRGDILSRAAGALAGRNLDRASVGNGMPLLDERLLRGDLARSLWYLHSQPPLFNLAVAALLRLPGDFAVHYQWLSWTMGLALYLFTYALLIRIGCTESVAGAMVVVFMLLPNAMWLESAVYYGLPLACMLLFATLAFDRALQRGSMAWLAAASVSIVAIVLTRAFFTAVWCALLLALFATAFVKANGMRRGAVAAVLLPFLLVIAFQVKQYALFRQTLGSSWFGCNLFTMTAGMRPEKARALADGKVSPLVNEYRNAPPETYMRYVHVAPTGIPALDETKKSTGQPNFNHQIYIPIGRVYLHDSLYLIAHAPHKYLLNVVNSLYLFAGYQIGLYFEAPSKFLPKWRWYELAAPFLGAPLIFIALRHGIRRMRNTERDRALFAVMLFNIVYVILVSCLFEKSEAPVYRHQIEPYLWALLGSALTAALPVIARLTSRAPRLPATSDVRN